MSKILVEKGKNSSPQRESGQEKNLFVQVPLEVLEAKISTSAMKLYLVLLKYARQSSECWPSQQTLGRDMNLKPRRITDLLKELETASLITIICRAKEGLSNIYRLLKVVSPKGGSRVSLSKIADIASKKDVPGKQSDAEEGMQYSANESQEGEIHALKTHIHNQPESVKELPKRPSVSDPHRPGQCYGVCDFKDFGEQNPAKVEASIRKDLEASLHIPYQTTTLERVKSVLRNYGVAEIRAGQLATIVIKANLDEVYVRSLIEWIEGQAASRTIYNPAGLLVQMVHQLAPVPLPRGMGVSTLNSLRVEAEQEREYMEKHLPRLIAIEERNLADAVSERDKTNIRLKLDKYLALRTKGSERAYPVNKPYLAALSANDTPQAFCMEQS